MSESGVDFRAMRSTFLILASTLVFAAACDSEAPAPEPSEAPAVPTTPAPQTTPTAQSPEAAAVAAYDPNLPAPGRAVIRATAGCQEWVPRKPPRTIQCPPELEVGETINFTSDTTCTRKGLAGREGPVTCPEVKSP